MIVNIPSSETYNGHALRQYYLCWFSILKIIYNFDEVYKPDAETYVYDPDADTFDRKPIDWSNERREYIAACQPDIQAIYSSLQNACELKLKSIVCEISPFLLIKEQDKKFKQEARDYDFSEFLTVDAVQLPSFVNSICAKPIAPRYVDLYDRIRTIRNKVIHQGEFDEVLSPETAVTDILDVYIGIWRDNQWLHNMLRSSDQSAQSFFHDGRYSSAEFDILAQMEDVEKYAIDGRFTKLFGFRRNKRRYVCHHCRYNATLKFGAPDDGGRRIETAVLNDAGKQLHCTLCRKDFPVVRKDCIRPECRSNVLSNDPEFLEICHCCCMDQDIKEENLEDIVETEIAKDALDDLFS